MGADQDQYGYQREFHQQRTAVSGGDEGGPGVQLLPRGIDAGDENQRKRQARQGGEPLEYVGRKHRMLWVVAAQPWKHHQRHREQAADPEPRAHQVQPVDPHRKGEITVICRMPGLAAGEGDDGGGCEHHPAKGVDVAVTPAGDPGDPQQQQHWWPYPPDTAVMRAGEHHRCHVGQGRYRSAAHLQASGQQDQHAAQGEQRERYAEHAPQCLVERFGGFVWHHPQPAGEYAERQHGGENVESSESDVEQMHGMPPLFDREIPASFGVMAVAGNHAPVHGIQTGGDGLELGHQQGSLAGGNFTRADAHLVAVRVLDDERREQRFKIGIEPDFHLFGSRTHAGTHVRRGVIWEGVRRDRRSGPECEYAQPANKDSACDIYFHDNDGDVPD